MNSMNNILEKVKDSLNPLEILTPADRQFACVVKPDEVHKSLAYLKSIDFIQLSILTCIDWIDDGELELVFVLMNWDDGIHCQLRTRIGRETPRFGTITGIYPGAKFYEREVHEFFGVVFEGNDDGEKPLFLEKWDSIPPLRKDFDPESYSDSKFPMRDRDKTFKSIIGGIENA